MLNEILIPRPGKLRATLELAVVTSCPFSEVAHCRSDGIFRQSFLRTPDLGDARCATRESKGVDYLALQEKICLFQLVIYGAAQSQNKADSGQSSS